MRSLPIFFLAVLVSTLLGGYVGGIVSYDLDRLSRGFGYAPIYAIGVFAALCALGALILVLRTRKALMEQGYRVDPLPRPAPTEDETEGSADPPVPPFPGPVRRQRRGLDPDA